jgi:hypothetical protein
MNNVTWQLEWKLNAIILISHAMCNGMERGEEKYLRGGFQPRTQQSRFTFSKVNQSQLSTYLRLFKKNFSVM